jgi:hypothetical protein
MSPLLAVCAAGSSEVAENSERLLELSRVTGQGRLLSQVLVHLFFWSIAVRDLKGAEEFARQALELAEYSSDEHQIFSGNFLAGFNAAEKGEYPRAWLFLERACTISDRTQAAILADPRIALGLMNCMGRLAFVLWIMGYPDLARRQEARLVALLNRALDAYARAVAISHALTIHRDLIRDNRAIHLQAEDALGDAITNGHLYGRAIGLISLGRIMVAEGKLDAGAEKVAEGMLALEAAGDVRNYFVYAYVASATYLKAHHGDEGLALVKRAISWMGEGARSSLKLIFID